MGARGEAVVEPGSVVARLSSAIVDIKASDNDDARLILMWANGLIRESSGRAVQLRPLPGHNTPVRPA